MVIKGRAVFEVPQFGGIQPTMFSSKCHTRVRALYLSLLFLAVTTPVWPQSDYSTPYLFTTFAGTSSIGSVDGPGSEARFYSPSGVAVDPAGNLYVADTENHVIRKITSAGVVSTFAGKPGAAGSADGTGRAARFNQPFGIAIDVAGNLYVADMYNFTIRKITPTGVVTTLAGAAGSDGHADGTGSAAQFERPTGIAVDSGGNVYVADPATIRKVTPAGVVTTIEITAGPGGSAIGTEDATLLSYPLGIAVDQAGNLFVADSYNLTIRKITAAGVMTILAGSPGLSTDQKYHPTNPYAPPDPDGIGGDARFDFPTGIALGPTGDLWVADAGNNTIRKITQTGVVTTLAGTGYPSASRYVDGTGRAAQFNAPLGLAVDSAGTLYVGDTGNNTIRRITPAGTVSTVAGLSPFQCVGSTDGTGSAARFGAHINGIAVGPTGDLYVADWANHTIRKITPGGTVTTLAGLAGSIGSADGTGSVARFCGPLGMAVDPAGNLYVSDNARTIRRITPQGVVTTVAGVAGQAGTADGVGSAARFTELHGMTADAAGDLYVADGSTDLVDFTPINIRKISPDGVVTTLGDIATADTHGLAVDGAGNLYLNSLNSIFKVSRAGDRSFLAGESTNYWGFESYLGSDGIGAAAHFWAPSGLAIDASGIVYVADAGDCAIRRITPAGAVSTLGGVAGVHGSTDGIGSEARFDSPRSVALDPMGNIYVTSGSTIRKGQRAGPPVITAQPQSQTVPPGTSMQLSVAASGAPAPSFQWYRNGSPIRDATGDTLHLASAGTADAGDYTVVVANELGTATSNQATLTVSTVPTSAAVPASGGGGAIDAWWILALLVMGGARGVALACGPKLADAGSPRNRSHRSRGS